MHRDVHFDTHDYVLTAPHCWFRNRNCSFEMKVSTAEMEAGVYEDISGESMVLRCLRDIFDRQMSEKGIPLLDMDWPRRIGDLIPDEFTKERADAPRGSFGAQSTNKWLMPFADLWTRRESFCASDPNVRIDVDKVDFVSQSGKWASLFTQKDLYDTCHLRVRSHGQQ